MLVKVAGLSMARSKTKAEGSFAPYLEELMIIVATAFFSSKRSAKVIWILSINLSFQDYQKIRFQSRMARIFWMHFFQVMVDPGRRFVLHQGFFNSLLSWLAVSSLYQKGFWRSTPEALHSQCCSDLVLAMVPKNWGPWTRRRPCCVPFGIFIKLFCNSLGRCSLHYRSSGFGSRND